MLAENSSYFKDLFEQQANAEAYDDTLKLPDVNPDLFDLAVQCLVTKTIALQADVARSASQEISILLDLVFLMLKFGFPDPGEAAVSHMRGVLINKRTALKNQHIRRAYTLPDGHPVCDLFCQAVVRQYMMSTYNRSRDNLRNDDSDEDEDDDDLTPAQAAAYRNGFEYKPVLNSILAFKHDIQDAQDKVLKEGFIIKVTKVATKRSPQQTERWYRDPLDDDEDLEFMM